MTCSFLASPFPPGRNVRDGRCVSIAYRVVACVLFIVAFFHPVIHVNRCEYFRARQACRFLFPCQGVHAIVIGRRCYQRQTVPIEGRRVDEGAEVFQGARRGLLHPVSVPLLNVCRFLVGDHDEEDERRTVRWHFSDFLAPLFRVSSDEIPPYREVDRIFFRLLVRRQRVVLHFVARESYFRLFLDEDHRACPRRRWAGCDVLRGPVPGGLCFSEWLVGFVVLSVWSPARVRGSPIMRKWNSMSYSSPAGMTVCFISSLNPRAMCNLCKFRISFGKRDRRPSLIDSFAGFQTASSMTFPHGQMWCLNGKAG